MKVPLVLSRPTAGTGPFYRQARWQMVAFLSLVSAVNYADRMALPSVLPALRAELDLSDVALGMLSSAFLWAYALGSPIAGSLADRVSRTGVVMFSLVAWSVVTALMSVAERFETLMVLRGAMGAFECLFLPAAFALIAQHHTLATRARAMSLISIGVNGGMVIGGSAAGYLAEQWGWRIAFVTFGASGLILALAGGRFLPKGNGVDAGLKANEVRRPSLLSTLRYLAGVRSYYAILFESMMSGMGMWIFFSWLPLFFRDSFGLSMAQAGFAGTFMLQTCVLIGIAVGGWISDRLATHGAERRLLAYGGCYLIAAPSLLLFLTNSSFVNIVVAISWFSLFRGIGQANHNPILCEIVPEHMRSTAIGLMNACLTGAGGCGVLLAGLLKGTFGLQAIFACVAGLFVFAGITLLLAYRFTTKEDVRRARRAEAERSVVDLERA